MQIENAIREFVEDQGRDLMVYTGTNGVMQLDDVDGEKVDIHLYLEDPTGPMLAVPK